MNIDLTKIIPEVLNLYLLDKVWNEPISEFRENIKPVLLTERSVSGTYFPMDGHPGIPLPTGNDAYYIYGLMDRYMKLPIKVNTNTWISTQDLCNDHRVLFNMFDYHGYMLHKGSVYIKYNESRTAFIIAVKKHMLTTFGRIDSKKELYFSVYYDSDLINDTTITSYYIPYGHLANTLINEIKNRMENTPNSYQVNLYVNGIELSDGRYSPKSGDYIDLVVDENVIGGFDVDMGTVRNRRLYLSEKDKHYKYVIHVPKVLNPDNKVITHNTCEFHVKKKDTGEGLYVHRCADVTIGQITHNDFSFPQYLLDSYKDYLGTSDVVVSVKLRLHDKDNVLLRDKNYIDLLYTHDDKDIEDFLLGEHQKKYSSLYFWKASHLEDSIYLRYMFDLPDEITAANMKEYIDGLGFYHVLSLICSRVIHSTLTDAFVGNLTFTKPYIYQGRTIMPIVYLNGKKIPHDEIYVSSETDTTFNVRLNDTVNWHVGDTLTILILLDGLKDIARYKVTDTDRKFSFFYDPDQYQIFEEIRTSYTYKGVDKESNIRYVDLTDTTTGIYAIVKTDTGYEISFSPDAIGREFLVYNKICCYQFTNSIEEEVSTGKNIKVDLVRTDLSGKKVPLLNFKTGLFYLNGRYLVEGVDYNIFTAKDETGISFKQLVIQNFEYLNSSDNKVEVYLSIAEEEDSSYGFVKDGKVYDTTPVNLWFPSISLCHVNGYAEKELIDHGVYYTFTHDKYKSGDIFEIETQVPAIIKEFLLKYHVNDDKERIIDLNDYFYGKAPDLNGLILVEGNHRIYSIYMNTIIREVLYRDLGFANDPDLIRFKDQLSRYEYLKKADPVLTSSNLSSFIDYYPSYVQYHADVEKYKIIRKFIEFTMPSDSILSGGDYHG